MRPQWFENGGEAKRRTSRFDENGRLREQVEEWVRAGHKQAGDQDWLITDGEETAPERRFRYGTIRTVITGSFIHGAVFWAALYTIAFAPHWSLIFVIYGAAVLAMGWIWIFPHILVWVFGAPLLAFDDPISIVAVVLLAAWLGPGKWAYADE